MYNLTIDNITEKNNLKIIEYPNKDFKKIELQFDSEEEIRKVLRKIFKDNGL